MRVIAGTYRSRQLIAPKGTDTRPTTDRLRETLFNVLAPRIQGARFMDLFAGSGAVGIEALSRGASFCWFAENSRTASAIIGKNLQSLGITGFALEDRGVTRLLTSVSKSAEAADIVFLDPPYADEDAYLTTLQSLGRDHTNLLAQGAVVIAEHTRKQTLQDVYGSLQRTRVLQQGDAALSFYSVSASLQT